MGTQMDWWDPAIAAAGLLVSIVVGLTGMGGGALLTPILVFFFGVPPLAAVSSDVVASLFMKPIGGIVHLRRGTVHLPMVGLLCPRFCARRLRRRAAPASSAKARTCSASSSSGLVPFS